LERERESFIRNYGPEPGDVGLGVTQGQAQSGVIVIAAVAGPRVPRGGDEGEEKERGGREREGGREEGREGRGEGGGGSQEGWEGEGGREEGTRRGEKG
jgi:hypothetical protein